MEYVEENSEIYQFRQAKWKATETTDEYYTRTRLNKFAMNSAVGNLDKCNHRLYGIVDEPNR